MNITPPGGMSNAMNGLDKAASHSKGLDNAQQSSAKLADRFMANPDKVMDEIYGKMMQKLNTAIGKEGEQFIEKLNPSDFTPNAVSNRILDFVENGINLARTSQGDDAALAMFEQAKEGILRGFNEAKEILTGLDVFSGKIEKDANKTLSLLQEGLVKLQEKMFPSEEGEGGLHVVA